MCNVRHGGFAAAPDELLVADPCLPPSTASSCGPQRRWWEGVSVCLSVGTSAWWLLWWPLSGCRSCVTSPGGPFICEVRGLSLVQPGDSISCGPLSWFCWSWGLQWAVDASIGFPWRFASGWFAVYLVTRFGIALGRSLPQLEEEVRGCWGCRAESCTRRGGSYLCVRNFPGWKQQFPAAGEPPHCPPHRQPWHRGPRSSTSRLHPAGTTWPSLSKFCVAGAGGAFPVRLAPVVTSFPAAEFLFVWPSDRQGEVYGKA